jgi:hypothetical protein
MPSTARLKTGREILRPMNRPLDDVKGEERAEKPEDDSGKF